MNADTINDAMTMQGGAEGALLAGRYRVVRQLGQGGMGSVWLAEDTQLDGKLFAIKMLPSILVSNKRAYRQLKDEALVAMQLVHSNIVQIRAFEENNGNPFLVMDYIEGQTLDDYLAEHTGTTGVPPVERVSTGTTGVPPVAHGLPESDVIRLLKPIAAALDYAHSKGVVHRDIKPGNVMIAKDGTPYILDFGIAREIQETMTRVTGKLSSGTLLYMSPEQLNGDAPKPAQDIYSFAAMAYECLNGEPPFCRGNIEFQIMNKVADPLGPHIIISGLVTQGLAKKPKDRPPTCAAVVAGDGFNRVEHVERVETVGRGVSTALHGMSPSIRPKANVAGVEAADNSQQVAIRARVEAKIRQKHLSELPDENGFAERKKALEDDLLRAELFFDSKGWIDAAEAFTTYVKKCDEVAARANEMHDALLKREAARKAREMAIKQLRVESSLRSSAEETLALAERHFKVMEFSNASKEYDSAVELFDHAVKEERDAIQTGTVRTITLPGGATMEMIYVAPGEFMMGSPEEEVGRDIDETQHRVKLTKGFWLGKYPVTQRQWQSVMGSNPSYLQGDDLPVTGVSWHNCNTFIKKVDAKIGCNARLPTEAEWEYACRAGTTGAYSGTGEIKTMGWYDDTFLGVGLKIHPVGQKQANAWGFQDMHGNVWEWCNDWYSRYGGDATDPIGLSLGLGRSLRGGAWSECDCRSARRYAYRPDMCVSSVGFRLCCDKIPPQ